ncbi:hypothetical protein NHF46_22885 [Arthrobacter alpinus]|nr:hypothetical protein [Arthrobacter alpinus]
MNIASFAPLAVVLPFLGAAVAFVLIKGPRRSAGSVWAPSRLLSDLKSGYWPASGPRAPSRSIWAAGPRLLASSWSWTSSRRCFW